jgi:hypothetical protein
MADLLTHVLVPYIILTIVGWRVDFPRRWIPVAMGGAAIPDLVKIKILVDAGTIEQLVGVPFSYAPISSLGGVLVIGGGIIMLFERRVYARVFGLLLFGGVTSLIVDGLRVFADGYAGFWLYPLWIRPPTPSLYVTSNPNVLLGTLAVTGVVTLVDRYIRDSEKRLPAIER